jgi:high-affinity iron transporter
MYAIALALLFAAAAPPSGPAAPTAPVPQGAEAARRIVATLQLAAQEYRLAFAGGRLANLAEAEEAALFIAAARGSVRQLPARLAAQIDGGIAAMALLVARAGPADSLALAATEIERRLSLALGVALDERPAREPSLASGERIYGAQCASCHGRSGRGDGPAAGTLTPRPADFTDPALMASATPLDIYRKVTTGVPATSMPAFEALLSREQRWDVTAYVLGYADPAGGARAAEEGPRAGQLAVVFGTVRGTLGGALELAQRGEREAAALKVLDAYMAYEAVEAPLAATHPGVVRLAEQRFLALRGAARSGDTAALRGFHADVLASLEASQRALTLDHSGAGLFAKSLLLIVREGFEAILVIGAIMAVLARAGAAGRRRHVRWGIAAALAASLGTAALLEGALRVTPAQREALEGGVMLVAAALLFYVSYWLVSKVEIAAWQRFVKGRIERAVASGSGLALAGVAFLAVYREGFETVLFYKALFIAGGAADAAGRAPVVAGLLLGLGLLAVLYVAIERFGVRIPMRPFFAVTSATLLYMAFTFAGTGIKELQEGAYIPATPFPGAPRSELLGIYPTVESLSVQAAIVLAVMVAAVWTFVIRPRRLREAAAVQPAEAAAGARRTGAPPRKLRTPAGV